MGWYVAVVLFFRRNMILLGVLIVMWSFLVPLFLTYYLKLGPVLIEINDFVLV
jgi:hypothetical protein